MDKSRLNAVVKSSGGFSLIELMVTMAILAVLATIVTPLTEVAYQRSQEQELMTSLRTIREAIDAYKQAADEGRIYKSADDSGYPKTLSVLVDGVDDIKDPRKGKIYLLRKLPANPMLKNKTDRTTGWGLRSYQSTADLPQEGRDVFDVYADSDDVGLNGVPYREW